MFDFIENIVGGNRRGGNSIFGEAREALVGGCWGTVMSAGFLFVFFFTFLGFLFGTQFPIIERNISWLGLPFVCILGISAVASPFIGILFGANSGAYSWTRHIGCFMLYIIALLAAIIGVTLYF